MKETGYNWRCEDGGDPLRYEYTRLNFCICRSESSCYQYVKKEGEEVIQMISYSNKCVSDGQVQYEKSLGCNYDRYVSEIVYNVDYALSYNSLSYNNNSCLREDVYSIYQTDGNCDGGEAGFCYDGEGDRYSNACSPQQLEDRIPYVGEHPHLLA